ncbi:hypothetical protein NO1_1184 [Candidatus Termititenax aidoneus]|uniref:Uncharacterized protein n=1 Tax=Termititenax aidoneus TaxID=2218524 RepID=A0A388TBV6_TERA1|nr:hypothetical protein NO1_1184 [Candidatus Termititenax aidoneus]
MTPKEKKFDCIKFKEKLQENLWKKSGATTLDEYAAFLKTEHLKFSRV